MQGRVCAFLTVAYGIRYSALLYRYNIQLYFNHFRPYHFAPDPNAVVCPPTFARAHAPSFRDPVTLCTGYKHLSMERVKALFMHICSGGCFLPVLLPQSVDDTAADDLPPPSSGVDPYALVQDEVDIVSERLRHSIVTNVPALKQVCQR